MRTALSGRYGIAFTGVGANLYRDGRDSVAWHGDRVARDLQEALVAIVSLGGRRRFLLRPKGGGRSVRYDPGPGDLLVMGGSCQRTWQHSVPKAAHAEPRISITFRHAYAPEGDAGRKVSRPAGRG
jgi:alkylated DNA repair dioxygenase AlkB